MDERLWWMVYGAAAITVGVMVGDLLGCGLGFVAVASLSLAAKARVDLAASEEEVSR